MTQEEIAAEREKIHARILDANAEVERARLELQILKTRCSHPNKFKTCHMGESCVDCPDCGSCL